MEVTLKYKGNKERPFRLQLISLQRYYGFEMTEGGENLKSEVLEKDNEIKRLVKEITKLVNQNKKSSEKAIKLSDEIKKLKAASKLKAK